MIPNDMEELNRIYNEAKSMVTKRATMSGLTAAIPIPGVDVAADVSIMLELLPAINRKFGLSNEQIDQLDQNVKQQLLVIITSVGTEIGKQLIGKVIGKEVVAVLLKKVATRVATKQVTKFIPIIGQAVAASVSFGAMKYLGNSHVEECYAVCKRAIQEGIGNEMDKELGDEYVETPFGIMKRIKA